ncbi:hypothetical protein Brsp04_03932 [Brucella sp. NBRC 12952]|uniref:Uncharacterized protein n=2 Tax=Brucella TaxID=234 RepID=A0A7Y3WZD1_9HYPH|nr:hypothetical protein [Brucella pseudogrignonensis]NNV23307.1 hypothetical protein [Brucella pseudogrignonensis]
MKTILFHFLLMLFALLSPAKASDSMKLSAYLERLNDGAAAQRLAIEVAELIRLNDKASMAKLAEVFEEKDGELLDYVRRFDDSAAHRFALSLQPCQYASISLRMIVMRLLDGGKPHLRSRSIMLEGTDIDAIFAEHMWRCETLSGLTYLTTIGTR